MNRNFEQKVREKAYEIWMAAGMAEGAANEHWLAAERSVMNETVLPKQKVVTKKSAAKLEAKDAVKKSASPKAARSKAARH